MLKKYDTNQSEKATDKQYTKSGVACTEVKCKGEMMIWLPEIKHPELDLKRASCGKCSWKGWV